MNLNIIKNNFIKYFNKDTNPEIITKFLDYFDTLNNVFNFIRQINSKPIWLLDNFERDILKSIPENCQFLIDALNELNLNPSLSATNKVNRAILWFVDKKKEVLETKELIDYYYYGTVIENGISQAEHLLYFTAGTILNDTIFIKKNNLNTHYKNLSISANVNLASRNINTSEPS
jgi:hypothetical protein